MISYNCIFLETSLVLDNINLCNHSKLPKCVKRPVNLIQWVKIAHLVIPYVKIVSFYCLSMSKWKRMFSKPSGNKRKSKDQLSVESFLLTLKISIDDFIYFSILSCGFLKRFHGKTQNNPDKI